MDILRGPCVTFMAHSQMSINDNFDANPPGDEYIEPSSPASSDESPEALRERLNAKDPGTYPAPPPIIPHDVADSVLGQTGEKSITQRIRRLNAKQRLVVELMLAGVDPGEACRRAGYASTSAVETIKSKMPELMDRVGLTDEYLINSRLKPLLDAETTKFFQTTQEILDVSARDEKGNAIEMVKRKELVIERENVVAHDIRLKALDMAFKLRGSYAQRNAGLDESLGNNDEPARINVNVIHVGG